MIKKLLGRVSDLEAVIGSILAQLGNISSSVGPLSGIGDPEGVKTGQVVCQAYMDTSTGRVYFFNGTPGQNTGWV